METGYFFICDVLGFSNIVTNSSENELSDRVQAWVTLSTDAACKVGLKAVQLISDTLFASAPSNSEGLGQLIAYAQALLNDGIPQSLPIRGAISYGPFEWGQLTYGKAVIGSHRLESSLEWVGVGCDNELPHLEEHWGINSLVCYPAPERTGMIKLRPVVTWHVPMFKELARVLCSGGLTVKGEILGWEWSRKISNTVQFGHYLRLLEKANMPAKSFYGLSPLEVVELELFRQ